MAEHSSTVIILAGPNGAGKSTAAPFVLHESFGITQFVNADDIARGLSGFAPETAAIAAGRIMLTRLRALAENRVTFAFETTLSTRFYTRWLASLQSDGYRVGLIFLYLTSPELAVERVQRRVAEGGHNIPHDIIRRRYWRGLHNLLHLYTPLADEWAVYNNSGPMPDPIAAGTREQIEQISEPGLWSRIVKEHPDA